MHQCCRRPTWDWAGDDGETWPWIGNWEDALPKISMQRRLTESCWLQCDEAGTTGERGNFAPSPPPPEQAPNLLGRETCWSCGGRPSAARERSCCAVSACESHRSGRSCASISNKNAMSQRHHRCLFQMSAVLTRESCCDELPTCPRGKETGRAMASGRPSWEGDNESKIVYCSMANLPPNTWKHRQEGG